MSGRSWGGAELTGRSWGGAEMGRGGDDGHSTLAGRHLPFHPPDDDSYTTKTDQSDALLHSQPRGGL